MVTFKDAAIDERLFRKLLALPYDLEFRDDGNVLFVLTPRGHDGSTWEELSEQPLLDEDFNGWKVETNAQNQIFMSPQPHAAHQRLGFQIMRRLLELMKNGEPTYETGLQTSDGVKIPDVMWASGERWRQLGQRAIFTLAPEICIEVLSPRNTRAEVEKKKRLYFEAGALEFWRCARDGMMTFFDAGGTLARSRLCPDFPARLDPFA